MCSRNDCGNCLPSCLAKQARGPLSVRALSEAHRFNINMRSVILLGLAAAAAVLALPCANAGIAPRFSWDTLGNMVRAILV